MRSILLTCGLVCCVQAAIAQPAMQLPTPADLASRAPALGLRHPTSTLGMGHDCVGPRSGGWLCAHGVPADSWRRRPASSVHDGAGLRHRPPKLAVAG